MSRVTDGPASIMQQDTFGCTVMNRFDQLLDDDADPFDILRDAETERQKRKKKEEAKKADACRAGKKESQKDRKALQCGKGDDGHITNTAGHRPNHGGQVQSENGGAVEMRGERRVVFRERRFNEMEPSQDCLSDRPIDKFERGSWDRPRGRGGMWYSRPTDGFDQRGKRVFDRQSGTNKSSVRPDDKREGDGLRNWGSVRNPTRYMAEVAPAEEGGDDEEPRRQLDTSVENQMEEDGAEPVSEIVTEMSLDEWKALQEQNRPKPEFNLRRPDAKVPSKAVVIHKSKFLEGKREQLSEDEEWYSFRRPANDITSTLDINFGSLARPSRGGRGGRGGRGRGSAVTQPPQESVPYEETQVLAPNPDDMEDFPALA